jgi:exopolyphosphatase/guanosine-5'-triphosphate,3'-diphosphate pyrophosphatase
MRAAILAVGLEIQTFVSTLQNKGWEVAVGSSGSILAIAEALRQKGWWTNGITYSGLKRLRDFLIDSGRSTPEEFPYINPDRAWVFAGGLAVLMAVFRNLGIDAMHATEGGIREGVLIDLVGQAEHRDIRDTTVRLMAQRYGVDMAQAERVEKKAAWLFRQVQEPWGLHEPEYQLLLGWAAQLHETGLSISHGRYHRHSAYLVEHSDLPGFSLEQQRMLGFLVRAHRRKFPVAELSPFSDEMRSVLTKMAILLRLAVLMRRARIDQPAGTLSIKVSPETITLMTPKGWLDDNPLTAADLLQEQQYLQSAGYSLQF